MKQNFIIYGVALAALYAVPVNVASAENYPEHETAVDNTAVNKRDRSPANVTADMQNANKNDTLLISKIRRALIDDDTLSMNGHNIKIISEAGKVTLRGPVDSADEKSKIENTATRIAGAGNVVNSLEIRGPKHS